MFQQVSFIFLVLFAGYMGVHSQELKHLTNEPEEKVPASEVWELYRQLGILKLVAERLKNAIQNLEVLEGDGGIGTVLKLTFVPRNSSYTERFVVIDDQRWVKVGEGLEGGCLANGCSLQIIRVDIIEKSYTSSIIKSGIAYGVKKEFEANDPKPNIQILAAGAQAAQEFLESKHDA